MGWGAAGEGEGEQVVVGLWGWRGGLGLWRWGCARRLVAAQWGGCEGSCGGWEAFGGSGLEGGASAIGADER